MTADARPVTAVTAPSTLSRIYGLGSVFGKTLRDSRRATIAIAGVIGLLLIVVSRAITSEFATPESRQQIGDLVEAVPPIMQGLAGKPVNVESLGGYIQYKYGGFFPLVTALWSILALSGTLAAEVHRGSMEIVAASAMTRRQIALQKLVGHVLVMTLAMAVIFVAAAVAGSAFAQLPGDAIPVGASLGYAVWLGLMALIAGALAFALAPFVGRGSAAGIAGAVMFAGFILNGYQTAIPELAPFANLTWFGWTTNHLPLAGQFDWASLGLVAVVTVVLFIVGIEAFARRDLGQTSAVPTPGLPRALVGLRGPASRATGELLPTALAWGLGLGIFGLVMGSSSASFVEQLGESKEFSELIGSIFPGVDLATAGGFLQLVFVEFGLILAGLAAATLVGAWAANETSGRTEMLLATPLARVRWALAGGVAVFAGIVVLTAMTAVGIALGATSVGGDIATPVAGTLVLGVYAVGLAGVGLAVGGLFGARFAGPTVALLTILTWLLDFLGPNLDLPDAVQQLALSSHMGLPMVGVWDTAGIVACVVLAVGGVAAGAWGMSRRDIGG
jgi:ABC-2 type transport system permease protein